MLWSSSRLVRAFTIMHDPGVRVMQRQLTGELILCLGRYDPPLASQYVDYTYATIQPKIGQKGKGLWNGGECTISQLLPAMRLRDCKGSLSIPLFQPLPCPQVKFVALMRKSEEENVTGCRDTFNFDLQNVRACCLRA